MRHIHRGCTNIISGFTTPSASEDLSPQLNSINVNQALEKELVLSCQKRLKTNKTIIEIKLHVGYQSYQQ